MMSDSEPWFSGQDLLIFRYYIWIPACHLRFTLSKREAERSVQMVKKLLKKAAEPYLALLAYRAKASKNGCCPTQLLMG